VGLDVSQKTTAICVVDEQGRRLWRMPAMIVAIIRPCGVDRSKAKPFIAMTDTRQYADRDIADALGRNTQLFPTMTFT
jgi:hypothetical protein